MMNLVPRVPVVLRQFRPVGLSGELDSLFDELWRGFAAPATRAARPEVFVPRINFEETDALYRLKAELPGLDEKDIQISLDEDVLTLRGERKQELEEQDKARSYVETRHGSFERAVRLPGPVDPNAVKANYKQGVLTVTLPKPPEAESSVRTIEITNG